MSQTIGVVVPCKNEKQTLRACLLALHDQQTRPAKIIVVDNGSTDGSQQLAAGLAEVVELPDVSISHLRNHGADRLSEVDVVGFVDADVVVGHGWLAAGLEAMADGADIVGSRSLPHEDATWVATRWAEIERHRAHDDSLLWSQHLLVRRDVFSALGGFDETLRTLEDVDLSARARSLGFDVRLVTAMSAAHHGFAPSLRGFLKREMWHTSTPGWYARMAPSSRRLVNLTAGWVTVGSAAAVVAGLVRRPEPLLWWVAGSTAGVAALGRVAGGTFRHSLEDGALLSLWSLVRVSRLLRQTLSTPGAAR